MTEAAAASAIGHLEDRLQAARNELDRAQRAAESEARARDEASALVADIESTINYIRTKEANDGTR